MCIQHAEYLLPNLFGIDFFFEVTLFADQIVQEVFGWNHNSNTIVLGRFTVKEDLFDLIAFEVNCFDLNWYLKYFFSSNVLSLLEFENVLLTIDKFECAVAGKNHPDISCMEPAVLINGFLSLLILFIVSQEDSGAPHTDLSPGARLPFIIEIGAPVS
jgi:hypothetical protein